MPHHRTAALAALLLAAAISGACASPATPTAAPTSTSLTADEAAVQVSLYLQGQSGRDLTTGRHEGFSDYFDVLAIEVLEMTTSGSTVQVRCDIALEPREPIPTEVAHVDIFHNIVGRGAKLGPFIVTHTFRLGLTDRGWWVETMLD